MKNSLILILILVNLGVLGCDNAKTILNVKGFNRKESKAALVAIHKTIIHGFVEAGMDANPSNTLGVHKVDYFYKCEDGGTVHFKGTRELIEGVPVTTAFKYLVEYDACKHHGVTISGKLDYTFSEERQEKASNHTYTYNGTLKYQGKVSGSCKLDLVSKTLLKDPDRKGKIETSFSKYTGTLCGGEAP